MKRAMKEYRSLNYADEEHDSKRSRIDSSPHFTRSEEDQTRIEKEDKDLIQTTGGWFCLVKYTFYLRFLALVRDLEEECSSDKDAPGHCGTMVADEEYKKISAMK